MGFVIRTTNASCPVDTVCTHANRADQVERNLNREPLFASQFLGLYCLRLHPELFFVLLAKRFGRSLLLRPHLFPLALWKRVHLVQEPRRKQRTYLLVDAVNKIRAALRPIGSVRFYGNNRICLVLILPIHDGMLPCLQVGWRIGGPPVLVVGKQELE